MVLRKNQCLLIIYVVLCSVLLSGPIFAQTNGRVVGVVIDAATGNPLPGANVFLVGTAIGTAADLDGEFVVAPVPPGMYELRVAFIGFKTKDTPFQIRIGETKTINVELDLDVVEGKAVVITAQAEGQVAAINQQLRSNTIKNVVSAERIQELPDANAAESVGRLPGISIKRSGGEGNKIVIRGLAPTYNSITIGGEKIPATDLDDRSVDLNMISPEILAGIEVTKALTPDMDADAFGGVVNFKLATAPDDGFMIDFKSKTGYNNQRKEFGQHKSSLTMSNRYFDERFGLMITGNMERAQRGSDIFNASYSVLREAREDEKWAPVTVDALSLRYRDEVRKRQGVSLIMDYRIPDGKIIFSNFMNRLDRDELIDREHWSESNTHTIRSYKIQRQIDVLSNSIAGEHKLLGGELDWRLGRTASLNRVPYHRYVYARELSALDGSQLSSLLGFTADDLYNAAYNDYDEMTLYNSEFRQEKSFERDQGIQTNFKLPFALSNKIAGYIKMGGKYSEKRKERDKYLTKRRLDYINWRDAYRHHSRFGDPDFEFLVDEVNDVKVLNYLDPDFDSGNFLNGKYDMPYAMDHDELDRLFHHFVLDTFQYQSALADLDDYEVDEMISAGYIMAEINLGRMFMLMPGARYEYTRAEMTARRGNVASDLNDPDPAFDNPTIFDTSAVVTYGKWFPMVHFRVRPADFFDFRVAYTKTISRPRLSYLLPRQRLFGSDRNIEVGNPDLAPQISTNWDAFLSFYGNNIGLFTLGVFYKEIDDLIYEREGHFLIDGISEGWPGFGGWTLDKPENNPYVTSLKGFEIEWQTRLHWMPGFLDGIVLNLNYTHIASETNYPRSLVQTTRIPVFPFIQTTVIDTFRTGDMVDQSDDIANVSVGYDKGRFSGRFSMLYQGQTLSSIGVRNEVDGFTADLLRLDFSMKFRLTEYMDIFYNWNNITNEPDESYQHSAKYLTDQEYYGWTMDVGLSVKL